MKKIYTIAALAVASLTMVSCSDFLDQASPSEHSSDNTFISTYYTSLAVDKVYGLLTQDRTYSQDMTIIWGLGTDVELVDGLGSGRYDSGARCGMNYLTSSSDSKMYFDEAWTAGYEVIGYCNEIIDGIRSSEVYTSGTQREKTDMKHYLAQAITLRAMMYLDMIRFWGDIPMQFSHSTSGLENASYPKTDRDVILDSLLMQLPEAISNLPWAGDEADFTTERVTQGYARALYAQIAMTRAGYAIRESAKTGYETLEGSDGTYPTQRPDYETRQKLYKAAALQLDTLIASGKHQLNPSYENEFYLLNQLTLDKTYQENLFEIPMMENQSGELGYTVGKRMNGDTTDWGYRNSSGKMKTTAAHLYSYREGDQRRDVTCCLTQYKESSGKTIEEIAIGPFAIYLGKWRPEWMTANWLSQNLNASAKHMTGINPVKMRYSQVLLMYAECLNELGGSLEGATSGMSKMDCLKEVHNRAFESEDTNYFTAITDDNFSEYIDQENAWEFTGENVRKWDLIRWGKLATNIAKAKKTYAEKCTEWPAKIYYKVSSSNKNYIDASTIKINEATKPDGYKDKTGFGFSSQADRDKSTSQYNTNLPGICSGLVGTTIDGTIGEPEGTTVKNRYIMPLGTKTLSDSHGALQNSYGY